MTREEKLNVEIFLVEHGLLLKKDDEEYESYSHVYDKQNAYYDYYQEYNCYELETIKENALDWLKNHSGNNEYYIITKQGILSDYICSRDVTEDTEWGEIKQDLNDCWHQPDYSINDIVWSAYKDENGVIHEDFIKKS
jgi:hypothetical protein